MFSIFETNTLNVRKARINAKLQLKLLEIKSKFDAEFRRFSIDLSKPITLDNFQQLISDIHKLKEISFFLTYSDPDGDLLPINNEDNFSRALQISRPLLKLVVQHQSNNQLAVNGYGNNHPKRNIISRILDGDLAGSRSHNGPHTKIGLPENFRCVSAIIDADVLPPTQRRVKLIRSIENVPLGFYIKDGFNIYKNSSGYLDKIKGIFVAKLLPNGLAAGTGLIAVNDEILEVNGIEVAGKTLDQVTDMMIANSSNLIITIKPYNQYSSKISLVEENVTLKNKILANEEECSDYDDDDIKEFIRHDSSGSSNVEIDKHLQNGCRIKHDTLIKTNNNHASISQPKVAINLDLNHHIRNSLKVKTKNGQIIQDIQSLEKLQKSQRDFKIVKRNSDLSINNDCNNFLMKSSDFHNISYSSLRTTNIHPIASEDQVSNRTANHGMTN